MSRITRLALVTLLAGPGLAGAPVSAFGGARTVVKAKHLIPDLKDGEGYGEKYTFKGEMDGGGRFYFSLAIANIGVGDHNMEAKGYLKVGGEEIEWKKNLDEDEWSFAKDKLLIRAGPATLSGTPKNLVLSASSKGKKVEVKLTAIAPAWRPKDGKIRFGSDGLSHYTVLPLMKAEATYNAGSGEKKATGMVHGTRSWSNLPVYEQARWTMEFVGVNGDTTVFVRELGAGGAFEKKRVCYLLVTKGRKIILESFDYQLKPTKIFTDSGHENGYRVPEEFQLLGQDDGLPSVKFRAAFKVKKKFPPENPLKRMNAAVRFVAERFAKPMDYAYDLGYVFEVKTPEGVVRVDGEGRYHLYHFNK